MNAGAQKAIAVIRKLENKKDFEMILKESGSKLVVIDFSATWCGPCKMIKSCFQKLAEDNTDVIFCEVDVDDAADIAEQCSINCMPTFHFYKNGEKLFDFSGANESTLEEKVKELQ
ncbi:thioredoxin-like [Hypanus sabinus]|uniref:thioredoxin-like n=1 Tax=Hypanus sabinus TaxID=79690 RepID=UPI0028C49525|nr:thioredoxin-like [Hypanus sabinus]